MERRVQGEIEKISNMIKLGKETEVESTVCHQDASSVSSIS